MRSFGFVARRVRIAEIGCPHPAPLIHLLLQFIWSQAPNRPWRRRYRAILQLHRHLRLAQILPRMFHLLSLPCDLAQITHHFFHHFSQQLLRKCHQFCHPRGQLKKFVKRMMMRLRFRFLAKSQIALFSAQQASFFKGSTAGMSTKYFGFAETPAKTVWSDPQVHRRACLPRAALRPSIQVEFLLGLLPQQLQHRFHLPRPQMDRREKSAKKTTTLQPSSSLETLQIVPFFGRQVQLSKVLLALRTTKHSGYVEIHARTV